MGAVLGQDQSLWLPGRELTLGYTLFIGRTRRNKSIAQDMALGHRTRELADAYGLSPGRVSQLRRQFHDDWERFTADPAERAGKVGLA